MTRGRNPRSSLKEQTCLQCGSEFGVLKVFVLVFIQGARLSTGKSLSSLGLEVLS